jgi:23S rRNA maturation-related 3'-5' exoribonuclease YhaM
MHPWTHRLKNATPPTANWPAPNRSGWGSSSAPRSPSADARRLVALTLQDATGEIAACLTTSSDSRQSDAGEFVKAKASPEFNGSCSFIENIQPGDARRRLAGSAGGLSGDDFVPSAPRPLDEMWAELQQVVASLGNPHVRALAENLVRANEARLRIWPAARAVHHAYRGGFLEHVLKMAEAGRALADLYDADADVVVIGALVHDISVAGARLLDATSYTREGNLVGHVTLGALTIDEACRSLTDFGALRIELHPGPVHRREGLAPRRADDRRGVILSAVSLGSSSTRYVAHSTSPAKASSRLSVTARSLVLEGPSKGGVGRRAVDARLAMAAPVRAQDADLKSSQAPPAPTASDKDGVDAGDVAQFLLGGALGLGLHESGHVIAGAAFGANPGIKGIRYGFIPFFAITHDPVSPAREYTISAAGFWVQSLTSEWLLTRRPNLRDAHAPIAKGALAFDVLASAVYGVAEWPTSGRPSYRAMPISAREWRGWEPR